MSFPPSSRYHGIASLKHTLPDGRVVTYLARRLVPDPARFTPLLIHRVTQGDRLDNLAARHLGDPELYWRLCDANRALQPDELTATPGRDIVVTLPDGIMGPGLG